ncbi:MAG: RsiV family protein [Oscillospiraceae bacterium]|jgi:hypothetical protein|nr:RsiV family protein [Oscillospiraceae bacterium]
MKKALSVAIAMVFALLLTACGTTEDTATTVTETTIAAETTTAAETSAAPQATAAPYITKGDHAEIAVDRSLVLTTDNISEADWSKAFPNWAYAPDSKPARGDSYVVERMESYADTWFRSYYLAVPQLTAAQVPDAAVREKLNAQFAAEAVLPEDMDLSMEDTVFDGAVDYQFYFYLNYTLEFIGDYVNVLYVQSSYFGGAHDYTAELPEVYSLRTGEKLTLPDVVNLEKAADFINQSVITFCLENDIVTPEYAEGYFNIQQDLTDYGNDSQGFVLKKDSLLLTFPPYNLAPFNFGQIEVDIPVRDFPAGSLKIAY